MVSRIKRMIAAAIMYVTRPTTAQTKISGQLLASVGLTGCNDWPVTLRPVLAWLCSQPIKSCLKALLFRLKVIIAPAVTIKPLSTTTKPLSHDGARTARMYFISSVVIFVIVLVFRFVLKYLVSVLFPFSGILRCRLGFLIP